MYIISVAANEVESMYREIYQACRWNEHPIYQAVMTRHNQEDIYVHDFVMYSHPAAGNTIGRIESLYVHVSVNYTLVCVIINTLIVI